MPIIYQPDGIFAFFMIFNLYMYAGFMRFLRSYLNFDHPDIKQKLATDKDPVPVTWALTCRACPLLSSAPPVSSTSSVIFMVAVWLP